MLYGTFWFYFLTNFVRITRAGQEAETGGRVLVHCVAGVSRSVSVVLAYLVTFYCDLTQAWSHVRTIRPWARHGQIF